jgi:hypothetical protein
MLKGDPETRQRKAEERMRRRLLAAQAGRTKTASVHFDEEEVLRAIAIRRGLEKRASKIKGLNALANKETLFTAAAMLGIASTAAGASAAAGSYAVGKGQEAWQRATTDKRYNAMIKADPTLKREKMSKTYFKVLDNASPYIASEPHVAAATVRSMIEAPEGFALHPKYMRDILGIEESRQKTRFPVLRAPTFKQELPDI